jgi:hypothetical protein
LVVEEGDPLDRVIDQMQSRATPLAIVDRNGELVGLLSQEQIGQWVMHHSSGAGSKGQELAASDRAASQTRPAP